MPEKPLRIVCFGDSITHSGRVPETSRWPTRVGMLLEQRHPGRFEVHNRGVGGHTSVQGFDRIQTDVIPLLPAVVLVQFGFNDANVRDWARTHRVGLDEFRSKLTELDRIIRAGKGTSVFIVNHLPGKSTGKQGNGKSYRTNYRPYGQAIQQVARELAAPVIDMPARLRARKVRMTDFLRPSDGVHLSARGNEIYADIVAEALEELLT